MHLFIWRDSTPFDIFSYTEENSHLLCVSCGAIKFGLKCKSVQVCWAFLFLIFISPHPTGPAGRGGQVRENFPLMGVFDLNSILKFIL